MTQRDRILRKGSSLILRLPGKRGTFAGTGRYRFLPMNFRCRGTGVQPRAEATFISPVSTSCRVASRWLDVKVAVRGRTILRRSSFHSQIESCLSGEARHSILRIHGLMYALEPD